MGLRLVSRSSRRGLLALAASLPIVTGGCVTATPSSSTPPLPGSVHYAGAVFRVPAGWRVVALRSSSKTCELERLESPTASSTNPATALKGDTVGLFPLRSDPDRCTSMRSFYDGPWRAARSECGLTEDVGVRTFSDEAFGGLGVWEYRSIPSLDIGLQLFGYGPNVTKALLVASTIADSAAPAQSKEEGDDSHFRTVRTLPATRHPKM